jgi:hypothetical protein
MYINGSKTDLISTKMKLFTHYRCVSYFLMSFAENQPVMFTKNVMNWKVNFIIDMHSCEKLKELEKINCFNELDSNIMENLQNFKCIFSHNDPE